MFTIRNIAQLETRWRWRFKRPSFSICPPNVKRIEDNGIEKCTQHESKLSLILRHVHLYLIAKACGDCRKQENSYNNRTERQRQQEARQPGPARVHVSKLQSENWGQ